MDLFTKQNVNQLLSIQQNPCVSIYLPVDKVGQDTRQGPIRLRKLIKATAEALRERGFRTPFIEQLLQPAEALYDHALFWEHQDQGLALFLNQDGLLLHQLSERCVESVTIAERFMILPLLAEQADDRTYYLLALSLDDTRLYLATHRNITECVLPEPRSLKAVVEAYNLEKQLSHHGGSSGSVVHGSASGRDLDKQRIEEFFRLLDSNLGDVLTEREAPVVAVCVDYIFPMFRTVCKSKNLMAEHISGTMDSLKKEILLEKAWQIVRTFFEKDKTAALQNYEKLAGTGLARHDIGNVLPMAFQGRIDTLFLRQDRQLWGEWDETSGHLTTLLDEQTRFGEPDLLSEAAILTLQQGGRVYILDGENMPVPAACACLLRF